MDPGDYSVEISHDGMKRFYLVHVPPQAAAGKPLPVVLNFHGGGGMPRGQRTWTRMDAVADEKGFIAVYPGGIGNPKFGRRLLAWNVGFCCGPAKSRNVDDSGFVLHVLDDLATRLAVDHTRVYATGISNGGFMSYRVAIDLAPRIAAIAPVAGALPDAPTGSEAVAVLHMRSVDDHRAPYDGGKGPPFPYTKSRVSHAAVEPVVHSWAQKNGCGSLEEKKGRASSTADHTARLFSFATCSSGYDVEYWKLSGAGHVWPGGPELSIQEHLGAATTVIDASREAWAFFARYSKPNAPELGGTYEASADTRVLHADDILDPAPFEIYFDRSTIQASISATPQREAPDIGGDWGGRGVSASGSLSLYSKASMKQGKLRLLRFQLNARAELTSAHIPMVDEDRQIVRATLGGTALYLSPGLNLYGLFVGANVAQERSTLESPDVRPVALGFGTYRFNSSWVLLYGAGFAYTFGRPLGLPLLGVVWKPTERTRILVLAPVAAVSTFQATDNLNLGLIIGVAGDQYTLDGDGLVPEKETVVMRVASGKIGVTAAYRLSGDMRLKGEVGVLGPRKLSLRDGTDELMSSPVEPSGYGRISLSYSFGSLPY
jgi:polyhydroxybutyrate depolymerase